MKVMIIAAAAALFLVTEVYAGENIQVDERRATAGADMTRAVALESGAQMKAYQVNPRGGRNLFNPAVTLVLDFIYMDTNLSDKEYEAREIPGYRTLHDEDGHGHGWLEEGFNLRSAELTLSAPVDPYFNLYATLTGTEDEMEVEEASFVTTSLPAGLQVKGGKFRSAFGRFNAFHQHAWNFVDAPLPYRAFLGEEGLVEKGVQVTYLPDLPVYALLGFEVLEGENEVLFGEDAESGAHAFTAFVKASSDLGEAGTLLAGFSVAGGRAKNGSIEHGSEFTGDSTLYGAEATYKWKHPGPGRRSLMLQAEYLLRRQSGDYIEDTALPTAARRLERTQDGLYLQALYRFGRWGIGARYEVLDLFRDDFMEAGMERDFGDRPERIIAALEYGPTEFSRMRLQYNHDETARNGVNREVFFQFTFAIGAHGAHPF